jgi:hypothetical protein
VLRTVKTAAEYIRAYNHPPHGLFGGGSSLSTGIQSTVDAAGLQTCLPQFDI